MFRKTKTESDKSDTTATDQPVRKKAKRDKQKIVLSFDANGSDDDNVG